MSRVVLDLLPGVLVEAVAGEQRRAGPCRATTATGRAGRAAARSRPAAGSGRLEDRRARRGRPASLGRRRLAGGDVGRSRSTPAASGVDRLRPRRHRRPRGGVVDPGRRRSGGCAARTADGGVEHDTGCTARDESRRVTANRHRRGGQERPPAHVAAARASAEPSVDDPRTRPDVSTGCDAGSAGRSRGSSGPPSCTASGGPRPVARPQAARRLR